MRRRGRYLGDRPLTGAALIRRPVQRNVCLQIARTIDLHLIEMKQDALRRGNLHAHKPSANRLAGKVDHQRLAVADAAEVPSGAVVTPGPLLAVGRGQDDHVVGVVQAGGVVEPVIDDDPAQRLHGAEIDLPPRVWLSAGMEAILAIFDAIDGAGRIRPTGGGSRRPPGPFGHIPDLGLFQPVRLDLFAGRRTDT